MTSTRGETQRSDATRVSDELAVWLHDGVVLEIVLGKAALHGISSLV